MILPILLVFRRALPVVVTIGLIFVCGLAVLSLMQYPLTKLSGDYMIYRLLPGTFGIFVLGTLIRRDDQPSSFLAKAILGTYAFLFGSAFIGGTIQQFQILAVTLGVLAGYPIIGYFARRPRNKFDEMMGQGAYGIFLVHFTIIWAAQRIFFPTGITNPIAYKSLVIVLSVVGGFAVHWLVERPTFRYRREFIAAFIRRHPRAAGPQSAEPPSPPALDSSITTPQY